jgi:hypothetical protein
MTIHVMMVFILCLAFYITEKSSTQDELRKTGLSISKGSAPPSPGSAGKTRASPESSGLQESSTASSFPTESDVDPESTILYTDPQDEWLILFELWCMLVAVYFHNFVTSSILYTDPQDEWLILFELWCMLVAVYFHNFVTHAQRLLGHTL